MGRSVRRVATEGLTRSEITELRALFGAAWAESEDGQFTDDDWQHATGGVHVLAEESGRIAAHASVVPRTLEVGGARVRSGYVEAVATWPDLQRRGHGSAVMTEIDAVIQAHYELGVLGTGEFAFYERLGWERWRGPTSVRTADGLRRTPDDDGYIMILRTPSTPAGLDPDTPIICESRPGDVW